MFQRFSERARRCIFFARYEASVFGTMEITAEELLLGVLREDKTVAMQLNINMGGLEAIRKELQQLAPPKGERVSTSVDLPVSEELRRALAFAAEEADGLHYNQIDTPHLVLGLLRVEDSLAAKLLRKHGTEYERFRELVAQGSEERKRAVLNSAPQAKSLEPAIQALQQLVDDAGTRLRNSDCYGNRRLKRKHWTRKEALGHLIDWAIAHRQWVTRAMAESRLNATGYPDEAMVTVQHYADFPWAETVDLWVSLNRLLIHVLVRVPEDRLGVPCRIGIAEPLPLAKLIEAYLDHCQDIVGQILARLD